MEPKYLLECADFATILPRQNIIHGRQCGNDASMPRNDRMVPQKDSAFMAWVKSFAGKAAMLIKLRPSNNDHADNLVKTRAIRRIYGNGFGAYGTAGLLHLGIHAVKNSPPIRAARIFSECKKRAPDFEPAVRSSKLSSPDGLPVERLKGTLKLADFFFPTGFPAGAEILHQLFRVHVGPETESFNRIHSEPPM